MTNRPSNSWSQWKLHFSHTFVLPIILTAEWQNAQIPKAWFSHVIYGPARAGSIRNLMRIPSLSYFCLHACVCRGLNSSQASLKSKEAWFSFEIKPWGPPLSYFLSIIRCWQDCIPEHEHTFVICKLEAVKSFVKNCEGSNLNFLQTILIVGVSANELQGTGCHTTHKYSYLHSCLNTYFICVCARGRPPL